MTIEQNDHKIKIIMNNQSAHTNEGEEIIIGDDDIDNELTGSANLKSCPFCGRNPIIYGMKNTTTGNYVYHVKCPGIECTASVFCCADELDKARKSAIEKWNKRSASPTNEEKTFQVRVNDWMQVCFGEEISKDLTERNHRFIEEALELVQATGATKSECHQLVDYVFNRDIGEMDQEVGGVIVTLAALCNVIGLDFNKCGETELARIWTKVEKIRAKQAAKPKHSPLPSPTNDKQGEEAAKKIVRLIAYRAWMGAANAFRLYPDNKHTFVDYWDGAKNLFEDELKKIESGQASNIQGDAANDWNKIKVTFMDCWEFDKLIPEEARWMAMINRVGCETASTKYKAFEEMIISLKVLIAYNSDYNLSPPKAQGDESVSKDEILDYIVKDFATPITRQDCYEAMEQYAAQKNKLEGDEKAMRSKEEILKEMYVHHTNVVNPDGNWATWKQCEEDGTLQLAYDAMEAYAKQFPSSTPADKDEKVNPKNKLS